MKRKIIKTFCLVVIFAIMITMAISLYVFNNIFKEDIYNDLEDYAIKISRTDILDNPTDYEETIKISNLRLTLIKENGDVIYDSEFDYKLMENHNDREEFTEALTQKSGKALRDSETIGKSTYYYALELRNGDILRIAKEADDIRSLVFNTIAIIIPIVIILIILCILISISLTKRIIKPIEKMAANLENLDTISLYDELIPFARKIRDQQKDIRENMEYIKRENNKIQLITKNMSEGIIFLDKNNCIISLNDSASNLLSLRETDYSNQNILNAIRNNDILESIDKANNGEGNFIELHLEGKELQIFSNPINDNGDAIGVICIILDITERYNRDKMRREFTANVSHDLKTPLTAISGYAELIEYNIAKDEDVNKFAYKIRNEASRLLALINDIIKLSELDEGISVEDFEKTNLLDIARKSVDTLSDLARRRKVTINIKGQEAEVFGNKSMLYELVFNLTDNAIRYNRENGRVDIEVKSDEDKVILSVTDTGMGIPAKYKDRIFERYFRVDKSRTKFTMGSGLGLSIVKHIANSHHAVIEYDSTELVGTQINIIFKNIKEKKMP